MRKIAFTTMFLIFIGIAIFYFVIDEKEGFSSVQYTERTEQEEYCLFKNGEINNIEGMKYCVVYGENIQIDTFFVEAINDGAGTAEISVN